MARGAENGYTYTGDTSAYHVTMLRRNVRPGASTVLIEAVISGPGTIPVGASVTVPTARLAVR